MSKAFRCDKCKKWWDWGGVSFELTVIIAHEVDGRQEEAERAYLSFDDLCSRCLGEMKNGLRVPFFKSDDPVNNDIGG